MTQEQGRSFTRLVHGVLVLGLVFLVLEVHLLRVAVEDMGLGYGEDDRGERVVTALDQPLRNIGRQLGQVSAALERRVMVAGDPAVPAVEGRSVPTARTRVAAPERTVVATHLESQVSDLAAAIERIDKRPKVTAQSLPASSSGARGIDRQAVLKALASLQSSPLKKSRFLTLTPKELLSRYGKPAWIGIGSGEEAGVVSWHYDLTGRFETGSYVTFRLYDGRVIAVNY